MNPDSAMEQVPREVAVNRPRVDRLYRLGARMSGGGALVLMGLIGLFLLLRAWPALSEAGFSFFTTFEWNPDADTPKFGIAAVMFGTVMISVIALAIAVPIAIATALFINEYAPRRLQRSLIAVVDLLAAIPSLIYGLWGRAYLQEKLIGVARFLSENLGFIPIFKVPSGRYDSSNFIAGVVVSLMVLPIATSVMREVFAQTPPGEKEGALALGATRWGMIRSVVLPFGRGGIIGGSMLGLGRALGETIAVALIISPKFEITKDVLSEGGNSVASLIALRFGEAKTFGLSALMAAGLALFAVTLVVNMLASIIVSRSRSGKGVEV
jgi:phosphate transport system permease protein